jgi:thioredoxin 2
VGDLVRTVPPGQPPHSEQVASELAGKVKLVKVDVDAAPKTAERFSVQAVPTLMVVRDGHVIARHAGAAPAAAPRRWVEQALAGDAGQGPTPRGG